MKQRARGFLLLVSAIAAIWLSVRNAAIEQWGLRQPDRAASFWPAPGEARAKIALNRIAKADGVVDDADRLSMRAALDRAPLLADPFIIAGLDASARGEEPRARVLFEEAQRRNPRATVARFWLLDDYYAAKDYRPFLDEVAPAIALQSAARDTILDGVVGLLSDPRGAALVAAKLRAQPPWRTAFIRRASKDDTGMIAPLVLAAPNADPAAAAAEQLAATMQLLRAGQDDAAYRFWATTSHVPAARGAIFDGDFAGRPGLPPFNWSLDDDIAHRVAIERSRVAAKTGLKIQFGGAKATPVASQLAMLAPGRYRIATILWSDQPSGSDSAFLSLQLDCLDTGKTIAQAQWNDVSAAPARRDLDFDVGGDCGAVRIEYVANPGIDSNVADLTLTGVSLAGL